MRRLLMTSTAALLIAAPLQAAEPPATLPKEFLAQLPLLMSLSDQEFEGLLASARQSAPHAEAAANGSAEENNHED